MKKLIVEVYPMRQSPNKWAWRIKYRGRVLCKSNSFLRRAKCEANAEDVIGKINNLRIEYK